MLRWALQRGIGPNAFALLETTGRRTKQRRHTPVGNGLRGDTFWLIAAHGMQADFVRNISQDPHVRVKVNRRWRSGIAVLMPDERHPATLPPPAVPLGRGRRTNDCHDTHVGQDRPRPGRSQPNQLTNVPAS